MNTPYSLAFITNLGWPEIVVILVVFILLFGAKKLPELARGIGKAMKEFKKATSNIEEDIRSSMEDEPEVKKSIDTQESTESKEKTTTQ